jgi:hypothetical protein
MDISKLRFLRESNENSTLLKRHKGGAAIDGSLSTPLPVVLGYKWAAVASKANAPSPHILDMPGSPLPVGWFNNDINVTNLYP